MISFLITMDDLMPTEMAQRRNQRDEEKIRTGRKGENSESGQIAKLDFAIPKDKYLVMLFCVVQMKSSKGFEQTGYMLNIHVLMLMHLDQKAELQNTIQN